MEAEFAWMHHEYWLLSADPFLIARHAGTTRHNIHCNHSPSTRTLHHSLGEHFVPADCPSRKIATRLEDYSPCLFGAYHPFIPKHVLKSHHVECARTCCRAVGSARLSMTRQYLRGLHLKSRLSLCAISLSGSYEPDCIVRGQRCSY